MRAKHVATALVVLAVGVSATAALRRFAGRRRAAMIRPAAAAAPVVIAAPKPRAEQQDAVVLRFTPRAAAAPAVPEQPTAPARCGDTGGRTKAGAPCGARPTSGGRCHHHKIAG